MIKKALLCAMCILLLVTTLAGCKAKEVNVPVLEVPEEEIPTAVDQTVSTRSTVVYYEDADGYLVPVMRRVAWEEGIAKETLSLMVKNEENDLAAARMGLNTVLPTGTKIDLDINDEVAKVSLSGEANNCADAAAESNMVSAIVHTLTEFNTVKKVQILINGHVVETLAHGTAVGQPLERGDINIEGVPTGVTITGAEKIKVYFESADSGALVPVTRMVFSTPDITTAVIELLKGPKKDSGLSPTMPTEAALLSVELKDGVVTVDFTNEFIEVAQASDNGKTALKSLVLTCAQFPDVKEVKITVNGKPFEVDKETLAVPTFVNSEEDGLYNTLLD